MSLRNVYHQIISDATGVQDPRELEAIEDIMRHDIFHSTLDWQTREELEDAARLAYDALKQLRAEGLA